jgi:hypothetical protein
MARHLVEAEFEVIPSDGAVEVIFIPTSSHYTFSRLSNRRDIAEFGLLSPDPRIRHASSSNYTAPEFPTRTGEPAVPPGLKVDWWRNPSPADPPASIAPEQLAGLIPDTPTRALA